MTKPRKARTDSVANLIRLATTADTEIAPPAHMTLEQEAWPFFHSIADEFARADWTPHRLELAVMLARTMASLEENQRELREEGTVIPDAKGIPRANPRMRVVDGQLSQVLAMRRSLAMTGRAMAGGTNKAAHQREANRAAEQQLRGNGRDDLLA
ncbi:MAG: hypothetical protein J0I69_03285 [Altererythrobacter sp.]|nr:hypothetical protein [Altererythrobacter sp.]OJU61020.1 MAG: hypothetical protein BGO08_13005 [Altererythrobacter sp. 66-12]